MTASMDERLAVRRRRRTVDSGWQRSEQPLTSHALRDCKLVGPRFLICSSKAVDLCSVGWRPLCCRESAFRTTLGHIGQPALCLQPNP